MQRKIEAEAKTGKQPLVDYAARGRGMDGDEPKEHAAGSQVSAAVAVTELPVPWSPQGRFSEMEAGIEASLSGNSKYLSRFVVIYGIPSHKVAMVMGEHGVKLGSGPAIGG